MTSFFVLGLGCSGLSTAHFLKERGLSGFVWDDSEEKRQQALAEGLSVGCPDDWTQVDPFMLSPGIAHTYPQAHPLVERAKKAGCLPISDIALFFQFFPHVRAVGITGTHGKSTTCALLKHGFEAYGTPCVITGNYGVPIFAKPQPEKLYILELSSYQLELSEDLPLFAAGLLHVIAHHLERYPDVDSYVRAKLKIFDHAQHRLWGRDRGIDLLSYDIQRSHVQEVFAKDCQTQAFFSPYNRENVAMAEAILALYGYAGKDVFDHFTGLPHRQEYIGHCNQVAYVNDSKATSPEAAVEAIKNAVGKLFWIAGGVFQKDCLSALIPVLPRIEKVFLIGQASHRYAQFLNEHQVAYDLFNTLEQAAAQATQEAVLLGFPATVLLSPACASFDQFSNFEDRGERFRFWVLEQIKDAYALA